MAFFDKYPYTDFHELNLDWIISKVQALAKEMNDWETVNAITFSGTWDITNQYPAWTIVSDNNIGYVSIKPVPAGILLTDGNYWRAVIDYTAQIAGMQTRIVNLENTVGDNSSGLVKDVNDLQTELSNINDKYIIIMGDSYNESTDGDTGLIVTSVGDRIDTNYITPSGHATLVANWKVGGAGFGVKSGTYTFNEFIDTYYSSISADVRAKVTDFLLFGGYNEIMSTGYAASYAAGVTFAGKVKQYFPNAKLHLAFVAWGDRSNSDQIKLTNNALPAYQDIAKACDNSVYVSNIEYVAHNMALMGSDGVHLNNSGYDELAKQLGSYIVNNNSINIYTIGFPPSTSNTADLTPATTIRCIEERVNGITRFQIDNDYLPLNGNTTTNATGRIALFNLTSGIIKGIKSSERIKMPVRFYVATTNPGVPSGEYDGYISISDGVVNAILPGFNLSVGITQIMVKGCSMEILTMNC